MNEALELHDSEIDRIVVKDAGVTLHFNHVYVHRSAGTPGVNAGSGWSQMGDVIIKGATIECHVQEMPFVILSGTLEVGDEVLANIIAMPLRHEGKIKLTLESWNDWKIVVQGTEIVASLAGNAEYVEEFSGITT